MRSVHRSLAAVFVAASATTVLAAPSVAASAGLGPGASEVSAACYTVFTFNRNTHMRGTPQQNATPIGLAYAGDGFDYQNRSQNGFWYGRDMRAGGATGWVPAANVDTRRVCD